MLRMDLQELWSKYNFPSLAKFWLLLKQHKVDVEWSRVRDFMSENVTAQLHKRDTKNKKEYHKITTYAPGTSWQMDLLDMEKYSKHNKGYKWILIVIDIFTRQVYAKAMKNKTAEETKKALSEIIKDAPKIPVVIQSDDGSEFKGAVAKLL